MTDLTILFLLRLLSATLLLAFFGVIGWWMVQDMRQTAVALQERTKAILRVLTHGDSSLVSGEQYALAPVTTIGRASYSTILLDSQFASNEHAQLLYRQGQWWLEDRQSRNGTLINGVIVTEPMILTTGDIIAIGDIQLQFEQH